jgi:L-ascorbate metabolism protein UlaG (beta-lactamase superfamily)
MKIKNAISFLLILSFMRAFSQTEPGTFAVTYIANDGFLIETPGHKILVDALFGNADSSKYQQPGDTLLDRIIHGTPPFQSVDVVLVTHKHTDHFDPGIVIRFLQKNRGSVLVCPGQVNEILAKNKGYVKIAPRIRALKADSISDTTLFVGNVKIRALGLKHNPWFEADSLRGPMHDIHKDTRNLGYVVETDSILFFHTGDGSVWNKLQFSLYNIAALKLNVAFLDRSFLRPEGINILNENLHAENIVLMHVEPGRTDYYRNIVKDYPEFYVFGKPGETRMYKKGK